ncbi:MAG: response regulator [Leptospiraceae bacterium]|nr:response regulator [Leptospiraceae bacterium]MCP5497582.1 response regulator [Leptospiraceae bacterium]
MKKDKLLIVEDDIFVSEIVEQVLKKNHYNLNIARNGKEGLELYKTDPGQIVITDLGLPIMSGKDLIKSIKEIDEDALILVMSAQEDPKLIIDVMKMGVYDYLIKPIDVDDILIKIQKAMEMSSLRKMKKIKDKEKIIRLENQMEWYKYKDRVEFKSELQQKGNIHTTLFENLRTSFTQGAGFGIISSLTSVILASPRNDKGDYILNADLVNIIKENGEIIQKAMNSFEELEWIIHNELKLDKLSCEEIYNEIVKVKVQLQKYSPIKNNKIIINDSKSIFSEKFIKMNLKYFRKALQELIINAMKFSIKDSDVIIIADLVDDSFTVSVMNTPSTDQKGRVGIPDEYQNIVFEPFFRLSAYVNEKYETLDYGLGLTMVDKIISKLNAKISILNIIFHEIANGTPTKKLEMVVTFNAI